jgi:hypothetical protein
MRQILLAVSFRTFRTVLVYGAPLASDQRASTLARDDYCFAPWLSRHERR